MPAEDFTPNYFRVEKFLRDRIRSGDLKPWDTIPPESELVQQFNISRMTVRQALSRLVFEGLVIRQQGRGSFVAEPRFQHTHIYPSFEEEMQARGAKTAHRLLSRRIEPADGKVAESLGLAEGTPVVVLERQRLVDDQVVGYEIRYFPGWIGEALTRDEIEEKPLVPAMKRILGRAYTHLRLRITASVARGKEAKALETNPGAPILVRENIWYTEPDRPIQFGKSVYRGDRYQMDIDLASWPLSRGGSSTGEGGSLPPGQC